MQIDKNAKGKKPEDVDLVFIDQKPSRSQAEGQEYDPVIELNEFDCLVHRYSPVIIILMCQSIKVGFNNNRGGGHFC